MFEQQPVVAGDTMGLFCQRHGLSRAALLEFNPDLQPRVQQVDDVLTAALVEGELLWVQAEDFSVNYGIESPGPIAEVLAEDTQASSGSSSGVSGWVVALGLSMVMVAGIGFLSLKSEGHAYQENPIDKRKLASDPSSPVKFLVQLAKDPAYEIRALVAGNPRTPAETLRVLATDPDNDVRYAVARSLEAPADLLEAMAADRTYKVRMSVAGNPNTPILVIRKLSQDPEWMVRRNVARNPTATNDLLKTLSNDRDREVRDEARSAFSTRVRKDR